MSTSTNTIRECITYLSDQEQDLIHPELKAWYNQAISDLKDYLVDEEQRQLYEHSDNEYLMDAHPEYANFF